MERFVCHGGQYCDVHERSFAHDYSMPNAELRVKSMNIRTEEFKAQHMIDISESIVEQTFTPEQWREWAKYNEATSVALTAFVDDKIMACGGLRLETNTMWVVLDKRAIRHKKELVYAARTFIKILTQDIDTDEIKCQVCAGFDEGHRFVQHLGFKETGDQQYVGFDDYILKLERNVA